MKPRQSGRRESPLPTSKWSIGLLGRTNELETLRQAVRQAMRGSVVLMNIEGQPGIGKTRLLDQLASGLSGIRVGMATCSPLERHLPYVPLAAALRDALQGTEVAGQRLPSLRRILPEISLSDPAQQFAEVDALEALVELVARHAPLVLLLDDLHWADPHTLSALSYLQRRGAGLPVAVVTASRSGHPAHVRPVADLRPDESVSLKPLTPAELAPLGIPGLHDLTGGDPRLVLEAITNGYRAEPSADFVEGLLAQCRAEDTLAYQALLVACALEQPFGPEPLATVLPLGLAELVDVLERLCERQILRIDGACFRFRHQRVREALLARLSPARRRLVCQRLRATDHHQAVRTEQPALSEVEGGRLPGDETGASARAVSASLDAGNLVAPLTEREREVLQLVAVGRRNREIATELYVTADTVKKHVTHILEKLGAASRTHAVARAREFGLVE